MPVRAFAPVLLLLALLLHPAAARDSYRVCLWNVQNFGVTDRFIDGKSVKAAMKPDSEIRAMAAILKRIDADILGAVEILQAPEDKYLRQFQATLKAAGLDYPHHATCVGEDSRIQTVLFSKFPIVRTEHVTAATYNATLKNPKTGATSTVQRRMERGINQAVVRIAPHHEVRVQLVHLKSKRPFPEIISDDKEEPGDGFVRRNEALIVRGTMTRALQANPSERILLMGDFNDTPRSRTLATLLGPKDAEHRVFDLWLTDWLGDWWTHFYFPEKSYERIDYMVASSALFSEWKRDTSFVYRHSQSDPPEFNHASASDHRPLVADFLLPPPPPATQPP